MSAMADLDDRLRTAYAAALEASQTPGARVEIHVGKGVFEVLRDMMPEAQEQLYFPPTVWGFPIIIEERVPPDSISIHTVRHIL